MIQYNYTVKQRKKQTTMNHSAKELKRQIGFLETMKKRATEKYVAKIKAYDEKIEAVKSKLEELEPKRDYDPESYDPEEVRKHLAHITEIKNKRRQAIRDRLAAEEN